MESKLIVLTSLLAVSLAAPQVKQIFPSPALAPQFKQYYPSQTIAPHYKQYYPSSAVAPHLYSNAGYLHPQPYKAGYPQAQLYNKYPFGYDNAYINALGGQYAYSGFPGFKTVPHPAQPIYKQAVVSGVAPKSAAILRQAQDVSFDGTYNYGFESEDGIAVQTSAGPLTAVGPEDTIQTVSGSYSYTAPDGTPITTNWIADENGFRADGAHLPKAPEAPFKTA